jgi:Tfp pilus assembly PilM family ATPase
MLLSRRKGWIGIDLGSRTIKLAQAERAGTSIRVAASAVTQRSGESGQTQHPDAQDCDWHANDVLAALSLDAGFAGRRVACVLPMHVTDLHVVTVPPGGEGERRAMISHELASICSNDRQEREFDFWEPESRAAGDASASDNVNVLSVPRELAWRTVRSLSGAGLHCEVMDGLPFALARAMDLACGPGERAPVAAVDWGYTSGTFCVVSQRRPQFTRHLRDCGFGLLVDKVGQALGLSQNEAVQVLTDYGLPGPQRRDGICGDM